MADRKKNGRTLFDRPKPTVGCSANGRRIIIIRYCLDGMREGKKTTQTGTSSGKYLRTTNQVRNPRGSDVKCFQCCSDAGNDNDKQQHVSAPFKGIACRSPIPNCTHIKFVNYGR